MNDALTLAIVSLIATTVAVGFAFGIPAGIAAFCGMLFLSATARLASTIRR